MRSVSARVTTPGPALAAIVLLGAALRFSDLSGQSIWTDELFTVRVVDGGGFWDLPSRVADTEAAPAPYYLLAWIWAAVFGHGDAAFRALPALLGTITIPVVYLAVKELSSKRAALIGAALCACSPILVWYSQEARAYALYVLLAAASFWLFARALNDERDRVLVAWAIASAAAIASYYLAAIPVLLEAAVLLWVARDRRGRVAVAAAAVLATIGAQLPNALDHSSKQAWIEDIAPLGERMVQTLELFLVGNSDPVEVVVVVAATLVIGAGVALALGGEGAQRRAAGIALGIGLVGLTGAAAGWLVDADYVLGRNLLFAWVPLASAVAIALGSPRLRAVGPLAGALLCAIGVWLVVEVKRDPGLQRVDYAAAAELIGDPSVRGNRTIVVPGLFLWNVLPRYLDGVRSLGYFSVPRSVEVIQLGYEASDRGPAHLCWWGGACGLSRDPPSETPPPGFELVERSSSGRFTLIRFRSPRPRVARMVEKGPNVVPILQGR